MIEAAKDREQLGELLTSLRAGTPVRDLAAGVRDRVGERDAVSFSTISSWCRGRTVPNPRQFAAFKALLAECGVADADVWLETVQRIRGADAAGPSPYPGLAPFDESNSTAFNGRDSLIEEALACLNRVARQDAPRRVMALVGSSGSGKTSLVRAGLIPRLRQDGWEPQVVEIGDTPETALASLNGAAGDRSVVVLDRLEQLLRPEVAEATQAAFLDALVEVGRQSVTVLVLRADFYDAAATHPALLRVLQNAQVLIGPMEEAELRAAIEGPAKSVGSSAPDGLLELVCAEAKSNGNRADTGLLPHLSYALEQTWNHGRRGRMSVNDYRAVGGLAGAIEQSAEAAYEELPEAARNAVRQMFLRLVNVSDDGPLTRRTASRQEIATVAGEEIDLIEHMVAARLLTLSSDDVEIAHEALLIAWPRLAGWVEDAREELRAHAGLRDAASTWVGGDRQDADLARGTALDSYSALATGSTVALTDQEHRFVEASNAAIRQSEIRRRQQVRRLRSLLAGTTALALVVAILAVVAVVAGRNAAEARDDATAARDEALSRQVAVTALSLAEQNPSVAAYLAVAAYNVAPTLEARSAVLELGNRPLPQRHLGGSGSKSVTLSADATLLVTSDSVAGTVELFTRDDDGTYQHSASMDAGGETYALALAPGDTVLAAGGTGLEVTLWDVSNPANPTPLAEPLTGPEGAIQRLAFSPDGSELAAVGLGAGVYRWDLTSPNQPSDLPTHEIPSAVTWSVAYSPDGRALAASDDEGRVHLVDRETEEIVSSLDPIDQEKARSVTFSPDSNLLAAGIIVDNLFRAWDVTSLEEPQDIPEAEDSFTSWVNDVKFSTDGRYAAAGASDTTVKIWDTTTWAEAATLHHPGLVTQLAFAEDGTLATAATDGGARVWAIPENLPVNAPGSVFNVSVSSETGMIAGVGNGHLQLLTPGDHGHLSPAHQQSLVVATAPGGGAISPDGGFVTLGHRDGGLELYTTDLDEPEPVTIMADPEFGSVRDVSWSPDGQVVAAVGDHDLRFFDLSDPSQPESSATIAHESRARTLTWSPAERLLAVTYDSGVVRLYDASDPHAPEMISEFADSPSDLAAVAFHPSGDILAVGGTEATVELWDISHPITPTLIGSPLAGLTARVQWAAFSPDGTRLVATSNAGVAWVWDVTDPNMPSDYAILGPTQGALFGVTFDLDGHRVAAGGTNWRINIWSIDLDSVINSICTELGDPLGEEEWSTHVRGVDYVEPC